MGAGSKAREAGVGPSSAVACAPVGGTVGGHLLGGGVVLKVEVLVVPVAGLGRVRCCHPLCRGLRQTAGRWEQGQSLALWMMERDENKGGVSITNLTEKICKREIMKKSWTLNVLSPHFVSSMSLDTQKMVKIDF